MFGNPQRCLNITLSQNLIRCSILSQENYKLIGWYCKIMRRQPQKWTCPINMIIQTIRVRSLYMIIISSGFNMSSFHFQILGDDNSSYFRGNRYTLNNDPSAMLLFDVNGYIAGFQTSVSLGQLLNMATSCAIFNEWLTWPNSNNLWMWFIQLYPLWAVGDGCYMQNILSVSQKSHVTGYSWTHDCPLFLALRYQTRVRIVSRWPQPMLTCIIMRQIYGFSQLTL